MLRPVALLTAALLGAAVSASPQSTLSARRVAFADVRAVTSALGAAGASAAAFDAYVARIHEDNARRVREGDLDHLVHYLLQSTRITTAPPIEPALGARALVEALPAARREAFLRRERDADPPVPRDVAARIAAFLRAVANPGRDARLAYFAALVDAAFPARASRAAAIGREYLRVMAFDYEKEFVAQKDAAPAAAVAALYRQRGLSTDTAVEAGYVVHLGLGVLHALAPAHKVRRVLLVGPGLDLAPRTAFDERAAPESYQPWAVIDALLALGLASPGDLTVLAVDINPRVVAHLRRAREHPPVLRVATSLREGAGLTLAPDYADYVDHFGAAVAERAIGKAGALAGDVRGKTVAVSAARARLLHAEPLDVVTERLTGDPFDLAIATNILPYFDDPQLALALANVTAMLAPGGAFLHNEQRPILGRLTSALGLPLQQSRHAVIATVAGAKAPLYDSVFIHLREPAAR